MKKIFPLWLVFALATLLIGQQAHAQLLFGNGVGSEGPGSNALFLLDLDTGTSSVFADLTGFTTTGVSGIAVDNVNDVVFWTNGLNTLFSTDFSGATTNLGVIANAPAAALNGGLAFDPGTGTLFATSSNQLVTIDTTTASATLVGSIISGGASVGGLAFDVDNNQLLGVDDFFNGAAFTTELVSISLPASGNPVATAVFTGVGGSAEGDVDGLAVSDGIAFLVEDTGTLVQLDLATGNTVSTSELDFASLPGGANGSFSAGGFVDVVPEPGSIVILMMGFLGTLAHLRRR